MRDLNWTLVFAIFNIFVCFGALVYEITRERPVYAVIFLALLIGFFSVWYLYEENEYDDRD